MEPTSNSPSPDNNSSGKNFAGFVSFDFPWIFGRIQEIMLNPTNCWDKIKTEALNAKQLFGRYLIPLAIISTLCSFVGQAFIGINIPPFGTYKIPFFSGLIFHAFSFLATLGSYFVSAFIIEKLAPKFETQVSQDQALRLVGFAATPSLLAGILTLAPNGLIFLVMIVLWCYACYLLWSGFQPMTAVADKKKIAYFATSIICSFLSFLIISGVVATIFGPSTPYDKDMKDFQKNIEKLIPGAK